MLIESHFAKWKQEISYFCMFLQGDRGRRGKNGSTGTPGAIGPPGQQVPLLHASIHLLWILIYRVKSEGLEWTENLLFFLQGPPGLAGVKGEKVSQHVMLMLNINRLIWNAPQTDINKVISEKIHLLSSGRQHPRGTRWQRNFWAPRSPGNIYDKCSFR